MMGGNIYMYSSVYIRKGIYRSFLVYLVGVYVFKIVPFIK